MPRASTRSVAQWWQSEAWQCCIQKEWQRQAQLQPLSRPEAWQRPFCPEASVCKKKTKAWKEVPYTRHSSKLPSKSNLKLDRMMWKRSLTHILFASEKQLVKILLQDGLLSAWTGKLCPRCGKGILSGLQGGDNLRHRCNRKNCQVYIKPQHLHPLFVDARGSSATSLRTQAALLMLKLNNVPHATIHRLLEVNHKSIESIAAAASTPQNGEGNVPALRFKSLKSMSEVIDISDLPVKECPAGAKRAFEGVDVKPRKTSNLGDTFNCSQGDFAEETESVLPAWHSMRSSRPWRRP